MVVDSAQGGVVEVLVDLVVVALFGIEMVLIVTDVAVVPPCLYLREGGNGKLGEVAW